MRFPRTQFAFLLAFAPALAASAQMHHVDAPEKTTRAVGVYEWTGELSKPKAARLVPVSVFIGGRMEQAGTYLGRPVPLALETGNVYSVEKGGQPEGLLNIKMARHVATPDAENENPIAAWYGYGVFALPTPPKKSNLKPTVNIGSIAGTGDDDRPHFVAPRAQAPEAKTSKPAPIDDADPEKPTLGRRDETADAAAEKDKKPKKPKPAGYVTGVGIDAADPDRPTLRHGNASISDTPPLEGLPDGMHQSVAVSDPTIKEPHVFAREWDSAQERADTLAAMEKLATADAQAYLTSNLLLAASPADQKTQAADADTSGAGAPKLVRTPHGVSTKTTPAPAAPAKKTAAKKAGTSADVALSLIDEELHSYSLTYGGLPTFVYSADVPVKSAKATTAGLTVHLLEIAQRLPSGDLQVAFKSATDSGHQDRTPWTRFVDVVDADGSHRGSFLLEQRSSHSRQFALYRLVSANAEQTFVTGLLE